MKKKLILFVLGIFMMSVFSVCGQDAEDTFTLECEPDAVEGALKTQTCWFYDSEGRKAVDPVKGYAGKTDVYEDILPGDDSFSLVSTEYFDAEGAPVMIPEGYAKMTIEYELHGDGPVCRYWYYEGDPDNDICGYTYRYFDTAGKPVIPGWANYSVYSKSMFWTDEGFIERQSYFGTDGEPVLLEEKGFSVAEHVGSKEKEETRYFGTDGRLINIPEGYARRTVDYTDEESGTCYYDADGNLLPDTMFGEFSLPYPYHTPETDEADLSVPADLKDLKPGDEFTFGTYEQDNDPENGWEPVEWQVLAVEDGQALVISKYGLDCKAFHGKDIGVKWEKSHIRKWLNGAFYENVFSSAEKEQIAEVSLVNWAGGQKKLLAGEDVFYDPTDDRIFLLSLEEVSQYYPDKSSRVCEPTAYAKPKIRSIPGYSNTSWWLRTEGVGSSRICSVSPKGATDEFTRVSYTGMIRPAFRLIL